MSSRVMGGRVILRPVGSPMSDVISPIRKMTVWPRSWKCFILRSRTVWPRCRSGAVGSKPAFTRSGRPAWAAWVRRSRRSSSRMSLSARRAQRTAVVLADHHVGGQLRPGRGDLDVLLLEHRLAALVADDRAPLLPGDLVEGVDALAGEAAVDLEPRAGSGSPA